MSSAPTPAPAVEPQSAGSSYPARIVNVFIAPSKAFTDVKHKSGWLVPFLLIAIVSVLFVWVVDTKVGFEKVSENQIKLNTKAMEQLEKATPEQRQKQLDMSAKITRAISYMSPVFALAIMLIVSALYLGTFNFGMGAQLKFGTTLGVVMYASLPTVLKTLLAMVTLFAGVDPDGFMIQNPVATNLGALVDPALHKTLFSIGTAVDVFTIWSLILTGIGFACVSKVKRGTAMAVVFGWYIVYVLFAAGLSLIF